MIIQKIQTGTNPDTGKPNFGPDIEAISEHLREKASIVWNNDLEVYHVTFHKTPQEAEEELQALKATSQLIVAERLLDQRLPKERIPEFAKSFDYPEKGRTYKKDWILRDPETDELYKIIQPQVIWEAWWNMEEIPAIVSPVRSTTKIEDWKQPGSTNPYMKGEKVTHNGNTWESSIDNNVWAPGVHGWTVVPL